MTNLGYDPGSKYMNKVEELIREKGFWELRGQGIEETPTWVLKSPRVTTALKTVTMN